MVIIFIHFGTENKKLMHTKTAYDTRNVFVCYKMNLHGKNIYMHIYIMIALIPSLQSLDDEAEAAATAGFDVHRFEVNNGVDFCITPPIALPLRPRQGLYRGVILSSDVYKEFYTHMERTYMIRLITPPAVYTRTTFFPDSYPAFSSLVPKAGWALRSNDNEIKALVKEVVAEWDGCITLGDYVISANDVPKESRFVDIRITNHTAESLYELALDFIAVRGNCFREGIVVRESNISLTSNKWRCVYGPNTLLMSCCAVSPQTIRVKHLYAENDLTPPPNALYKDIIYVVRTLGSSYCAIDIVERTDGSWIISNCYDGGVATTSQSPQLYWNDMALVM